MKTKHFLSCCTRRNESGLNLSPGGWKETVLMHFREEFGLETRETEGSVYLGGVQ